MIKLLKHIILQNPPQIVRTVLQGPEEPQLDLVSDLVTRLKADSIFSKSAGNPDQDWRNASARTSISAKQPEQAADTFFLHVEGEMKRLRLSRSIEL